MTLLKQLEVFDLNLKKMKNKLWIKTRVFLSFTVSIILIVNIFTYFLYFFVSENVQKNINKSLYSEYETIKTFIDIQKTNIFSLPKYEIEKLNKMWVYFYIWNNDIWLKNKYHLGFKVNNNETIFRWDYRWYNIIIWKITNDLKNFKKTFIDIVIILNIFLVISIFLLSYFITNTSLKPLLNLTRFLNNYKFREKQKLLKNEYWSSEIWKLTNAINSFIKNNNNIHESQINFIQDTSHELKTPLMQIQSNIELIEDNIKEKKIKDKLESIKNSVNNINTIIKNLWFILKWENSIKTKEKINIYDFLKEFIKNYESLLIEKNIKVNIEKKNNLIIENNNYYLERLFSNIISNSIHYNKWNNKIKIIVDNNNIKIIDEWIWINKEDLNKIFTRFYRNENSWLYYKNWNWLWLVIVKKICDIFWWEIQINSEKWKWTTFKIIL